MNNVEFVARQSKKLFIIEVFSALIFEIFFCCLLIFSILSISYGRPKTTEDFFGYIYMLCLFGILSVIFVILLSYFIYNYKSCNDIYTFDKMYRRKGKKIIFEIPYKNIANIKYGFESIFFFLKEPIVKINGKKGPRNFYAHYSKYDIDRIIHIINSEYIR